MGDGRHPFADAYSAAAFGIVLLGAFAQAVSGFGYALVTVPLLAAATGPRAAVVMSALTGIGLARHDQAVVQCRSFSGLRTVQIWLMRSPTMSNAITITVTPSRWATRPGRPLTVRSSIVIPGARPAMSTV